MTRPEWDHYFMGFAKLAATRASCPRLSVGAVLVRDNRILATGYNGAPSGLATCLDEGCTIVDNSCKKAVHAEANALLTCARHGVTTAGSTLYVTHSPCIHCLVLVVQAGVREVWYDAPFYRVPDGYERMLPHKDFSRRLV